MTDPLVIVNDSLDADRALIVEAFLVLGPAPFCWLFPTERLSIRLPTVMSVLAQSPFVGWLAETEGGISTSDARRIIESEATIAVIERGHSALAINRDIRDRLRRERRYLTGPVSPEDQPTLDQAQTVGPSQARRFELLEDLDLLIRIHSRYRRLPEILLSITGKLTYQKVAKALRISTRTFKRDRERLQQLRREPAMPEPAIRQ
jgi:hypothetical protein